jgi:hypothetical protein
MWHTPSVSAILGRFLTLPMIVSMPKSCLADHVLIVVVECRIAATVYTYGIGSI